MDEWKETTMGCLQGGRASPGLWIIGMNGLLQNLEKDQHFNVAFADDLTLIVNGCTHREIEEKFNQVIKIIGEW